MVIVRSRSCHHPRATHITSLRRGRTVPLTAGGEAFSVAESSIKAIVKAFGVIAHSNTSVGSHHPPTPTHARPSTSAPTPLGFRSGMGRQREMGYPPSGYRRAEYPSMYGGEDVDYHPAPARERANNYLSGYKEQVDYSPRVDDRGLWRGGEIGYVVLFHTCFEVHNRVLDLLR